MNDGALQVARTLIADVGYRSLFVTRGDVYAKSYFSKKTGRVGYTPACAHEWERGVCGKPRVKCTDCLHREFLPLDSEILKAHFRGTGREGVGIVTGYPLIDDDKTRVLAVDFDKDDWRQSVGAFRSVCEREGVPVAIERSRSGNGAHVGCSLASWLPRRTPASSDALC